MSDEYQYVCKCGDVANGPILVTSATAKNPGAVFWSCAKKQDDPTKCKFFEIIKKPAPPLVAYTQRLRKQKEAEFHSRQSNRASNNNQQQQQKPLYPPPQHHPSWDQSPMEEDDITHSPVRPKRPAPSEPIDIPNSKRARMETKEQEGPTELQLARQLMQDRKIEKLEKLFEQRMDRMEEHVAMILHELRRLDVPRSRARVDEETKTKSLVSKRLNFDEPDF